VFSLLVLLRPLTSVGSAVYEFANFIAHREKDRGHIHAYLDRTKRLLDQLGKQSGVLEIKPVFSKAEISHSINQVLQHIGLPSFEESHIDQILVCIMSLLQEVRILDRKGAELGRLILVHTASELQLLGEVWVLNKLYATFPVLIAPNRYIPGPNGGTPMPTVLVEVSVRDGKLRFIPVAKATTGADKA
jgi:hypothetical protein